MSVKLQEGGSSSQGVNLLINDKQAQKSKKTRKTRVRWSKVQDLKYYLFLYHHKSRFIQSDVRRSLRMFKQMAYFMKSRDASQCRVRHLKLVRKYEGIEGCLQNYISSHPEFAVKYSKIKDYLHILEDNLYFGDFQMVKDQENKKFLKQETDLKLHTDVKLQDSTIVNDNKIIQMNTPMLSRERQLASLKIQQKQCKIQQAEQEYVGYYPYFITDRIICSPIYYK